jgi:hypothetical protein
MGVGRKRKDGNPLGLEPRVEWHHGQFRYLHRDGTKEGLGADVDRANQRARIYNDPEGTYGTLGSYMQLFLAAARQGKLPADWKLGPRTIEDYEEEMAFIKATPLWAMYPLDLARDHAALGEYRDNRVVDGKGKRRANIGLSAISSTFRWMLDGRLVPGLQVNPVKLVIRFKQKAKDRYVEDHEYLPVYGIAQRSVCMAMRWSTRRCSAPLTCSASPQLTCAPRPSGASLRASWASSRASAAPSSTSRSTTSSTRSCTCSRPRARSAASA